MSDRNSGEGTYLLFASGNRPDLASIRAFASARGDVAITHVSEPAGTAPSPANDDGLQLVEILRDGLAFDLGGLAPGPHPDPPAFAHRFDHEDNPPPETYEAVRLAPGAHLASSGASMPVIRALSGLARDMVHEFESIEAVGWSASRSLIGRRFFESTVTAWLDGGAFPALGMTAFRETSDGALQSEGLEYLIGQELRIEPELATDKVAATRLGIRLVNQLVLVGALERSEHITAPDGSRLVMKPSQNSNFVRVWIE